MADHPQHRPVTLASHGVVSAPHYLAAQAGLDLLKTGGNAIDAAIAASAVLQVVHPQLCGLGGDLFALVYSARDRKLHGLNASGAASHSASIERYHSLGYTCMPAFGIHTVTVPGCPDGWQALSDRFGNRGLDSCLAPAISYARDGFPVGPGLHAALQRMNTMSHTHPAFRQNFMPGGNIPAAGSMGYAPDLARTLERIGERGAADFYRGELARQIADFFAREGGLLDNEDLANHASQWVQPLSVNFAGMQIHELPPNTQGITALQMLGMLDGLQLGPEPDDPLTVHLTVEAKKLAFADRSAYLTDLNHMRVSPASLIEPAYLARRAALISSRAAESATAGSIAGDTIYLCATDEAGNVVSLIQSNYRGFGSGVVVEGTGISLQNRGAYFSLDPEAANALAPSKRTLHTLIPSIAMRDDKPLIVFRAMGGDGQAQTHAQVYTALLKYGLNMQAAIEMPRWLHGVDQPGDPEALYMENRFPDSTLADLTERGHTVRTVNAWHSMMGHAQGILIDNDTGIFHGGADPRGEGAAVGW